MFEYIKEWKDCVIYLHGNALVYKSFSDIEKSNKKKTKNKNLWIIYKKTKRGLLFCTKILEN